MRPFANIINEFNCRIPFYFNDFLSGFQLKVLSCILLLYFINIIPAITFGVFLQSLTNSNYGVIEVLASTSLSGILYSIFAGQPLIIVGVTGPISIFSTTLYSICQSLDIPFLTFMFFVAIWSCIFHLVLSIFNMCSLVSLISRFTCEIFSGLIGVLFIYEGIIETIRPFSNDINIAAWALLFTLFTVVISTKLDNARSWTLVPRLLGSILADYSMPITVVTLSALQQIPAINNLHLSLLHVPSSFKTTSGREWIINPASISIKLAFAAILPAIVLTILIFFDHNVSSLLSQSKSMNLKKPSAYNYDFVIVGLSIIVTSIFGLPCTHGLIPQAPIHVLSLANTKQIITTTNGVSNATTIVENVIENRLSNLVTSILIGATVLSPPLLKLIGQIPESVLAGIFIYMGFETLSHNQFTSRLLLFMCRTEFRNLYFKHFDSLPADRIFWYTGIQLICVAVIFGITFTPAAIAFPVFIGLLVPFRMFVITKVFSVDQLKYLDGEEDQAEGNVDEPLEL